VTHLWEIDHPYYAAEGNYFATGWHNHFASWEAFTAETHFYKGDRDQNLLYRWDWRKPGHHDWTGTEMLSLYFVLQRKGICCSVEMPISEAHEPTVRRWLDQCAGFLAAIWEPIVAGGAA
jgi:hypothetical protein